MSDASERDRGALRRAALEIQEYVAEIVKPWGTKFYGHANAIQGLIWEHFAEQSLSRARAEEREACEQIAIAIDSGRGNEKEIARAIRGRGNG